MTALPKGGQRGGQGAVMAGRFEAQDSLDDFPTPPAATRALVHHVLGPLLNLDPDEFVTRNWMCWEPAANRRIMSDVLAEFSRVTASDVHDYGYRLNMAGSFVGAGADVALWPHSEAPDFVISNPPFRLGEEFVRTAMIRAKIGVAMFCRTTFIESASRYPLFTGMSFACFAPFAGRIALVKGRWDPKASTATSYAWFLWLKDWNRPTRFILIPPDARQRLSKPDDVQRFATRA